MIKESIKRLTKEGMAELQNLDKELKQYMSVHKHTIIGAVHILLEVEGKMVTHVLPGKVVLKLRCPVSLESVEVTLVCKIGGNMTRVMAGEYCIGSIYTVRDAARLARECIKDYFKIVGR